MKKATRQQTKVHNNRLVLKSIYHNPEISRADLARLTGLTRTTVSDVVSDLMEAGLVAEVAVGPSAGGKPPILLSVVDDSRHMIGIDLANSEFRGAIVNLRGEIKQRVSLPVEDLDGDAALDAVHQLIGELLSQDAPLLGIGIGTPGLMDSRRGVVRNAVNLNWKDLPLGDLLEERYRLPVYIANDSQVAALAEYTFGGSRNVPRLAVIKAGRGVGAGIVLNGQLYYGDSFGAGEIGHVVVVENGEVCRCGNRGCLETVASSRAMITRARESFAQSRLKDLVPSSEKINTAALVEAFEAGDPVVEAIVQDAAEHLGKAAATIVGLLNIERIVIAGSAAEFGDGLLLPAQRRMEVSALQSLTARTEIELSPLGTDIVILGAAALLLANELGLS